MLNTQRVYTGGRSTSKKERRDPLQFCEEKSRSVQLHLRPTLPSGQRLPEQIPHVAVQLFEFVFALHVRTAIRLQLNDLFEGQYVRSFG